MKSPRHFEDPRCESLEQISGKSEIRKVSLKFAKVFGLMGIKLIGRDPVRKTDQNVRRNLGLDSSFG